MSERLEMDSLGGESSDGSEEEEDEEEGSSGESVSGSASESSGEDGEESSEGEEEDEDEPVLKYRRFAKEVVTSINEGRSDLQVFICAIAVHSKVGV